MNVPWEGLIAGQIKSKTDYDHFINIEGVDYHYRHFPAKKKNAKDIVLLHGFASSTYTWEKIDYRLNEAGFNVWSLDMRGFGWSDKPKNGEYTPEALMEDVNRWMDHMGLEKVIFVGNSYGGGIGALTAFSFPNKIDKLILIDPGGLRMKLPLIFKLIRLPLTEYYGDTIFGKWMVKWILTQVTHDNKKITREQIDNYYDRLTTPGATRAQVELSRAIDFDHLDMYVERFSEIKQKTLLIWGEGDKWIPLELGYKINRLIKNSTLAVLPDCGHIPQEEKPDETLKLILNFIQGKDIRDGFHGHMESVFKIKA